MILLINVRCHLLTELSPFNEDVYESIIARSKKHARLPFSIIHNGIDETTNQCSRVRTHARSRHEFKLNDDHFIIGAVGRWIAIKRYSLLIRQFAIVYKKYPHIRLFLIGYGPEENNLRALAEGCGCSYAINFIVINKHSVISHYSIALCCHH